MGPGLDPGFPGAVKSRPVPARPTLAAHHRCTVAAAAQHCRSRLSLAVLRGMARQFERGFPTADGDVEGDHDDLCFL